MPDNTCTWWPDGWLWNPDQWLSCCLAHDVGGSDWGLFLCVAETGGPLEWAMGAVMLIGVILGRPIYRKWKGRKNADHL